MCQGGNNQAINISENRLHRLTLFRRRGWQLRLEIARFHLREHWQIFDMFEVIRDPIDEFMAIAPEFFGRHVAEIRRFTRFFSFLCFLHECVSNQASVLLCGLALRLCAFLETSSST